MLPNFCWHAARGEMFSKEMKQFAENLQALREFVDLINPFLRSHIEKQVKANATPLRPLFLALSKAKPEFTKRLSAETQAELEKQVMDSGIAMKVNSQGQSVSFTFQRAAMGEEFALAMDRLDSSLQHQRSLYRS